jgi:enoyl-CoA hydratase/carnithine racemase
MDFKNLILTRTGPIDIITLNRPDSLNAFSYEMIDEMVAVLDELANDWSSWVLVIKAAGRGFCSGHDVAESLVPPGETIEGVRQINRRMLGIPLKLQRLEKVTIASVQGVALGFGFDLALACDLRVAAEQARFSQGFLNIGLAPGMGGAWQLPRIIGLTKAAELLFTGDFISAEEAYRYGMLNKLVSAEKLEEETMGLANKLAKGAPAAIRQAKYLMYNALQTDFAAALDACNVAETITLFTEDFKEGESAMKEKREARYKGR